MGARSYFRGYPTEWDEEQNKRSAQRSQAMNETLFCPLCGCFLNHIFKDDEHERRDTLFCRSCMKASSGTTKQEAFKKFEQIEKELKELTREYFRKVRSP